MMKRLLNRLKHPKGMLAVVLDAMPGTPSFLRAHRAHRYNRYLPQSIIFEEGGISPLIRAAMVTTSSVVIALILWASLTEVKEVAVTSGTVAPSSAIRTIQHLEGGIVDQILVHEGELVDAGQVLVRLDDTQAKSELEQLKAREAGLELRAERLRAFAQGRSPDFPTEEASDSPQLRDQAAIYKAQQQTRTDTTIVLQKQIDQRKADSQSLQQQIAALGPQIKLARDEVAIRQEGFQMGLNSRLIYLQAEREAERLEGERTRLQGQLKASNEALGEAQRKLTEQGSKLSQDAYNEMGTVTAELAQLREAVTKAEDRVNRLEITAPVRGLVQDFRVTGVGSVIAPGGEVMHLVPVDDELQVETRIQPRDVGHVQVGQSVTVKVSSYDFSRFGAVDGVLEQVSPATFLDEEKKPYYKGWIRLKHPYVGQPQNKILPGMTVQADIITGQKTVLEYLLKPVVLAYAQALHER